MLRSLYSGISGLRNHQIRMDSVGNNISNVNTVGYKSSRTNFIDAISQTIRSGSATTNPAQLGTGINVGSVSNSFVQGSLQSTGRTLDLAIQGKGFFAVQAMDSTGTLTGSPLFSREGIFFLDQNNNLVNSNGYAVHGYLNTTLYNVAPPTSPSGQDQPAAQNTATGKIIINPTDFDLSSLSIDKNGYITALAKAGGAADANAGKTVFIGQIALASFANQEGLEKKGQSLYGPGPASGAAVIASNNHTANGAKAEINSGYTEMSNVDLSEEFVNLITTQRGYQANARVITTSDTLLEELIQLKR
ncbi:MAG: flagellar hook-basal body protein [Bacillota bacterium]